MQMENPAALAQVMIGDLNGTIVDRFETKEQLYYYQPDINGPVIPMVEDHLKREEFY
jgi:hypothetical protein